LLNQSGETLQILDRFAGRAPQKLHLILAARYLISLPSLVNWRVKGEVLEIGQQGLAFNDRETAALFHELAGMTLRPEEMELLAGRVEGWAIGLSLVCQRLRRGGRASLDQILGQITGSSGELFTYLAREVLQQLPEDIQAFLRVTAVLRELRPPVCDALRQAGDSAQLLRYLAENSLFLVDLGEGHSRYHHLFHDLLLHGLAEEEAQGWHQKAAAIFRAQNESEEAIFHLLAAADFEAAAAVLEDYGREMVRAGRLDTLSNWLGSLPPAVLAEHAPLLSYLGDIARLRSHFDQALGWYKQAETRSRARSDAYSLVQALRGQAQIYLDTVNPSQAEQLLQEALRLADGQDDRESRARLYDLLAENMLNQGRFKETEHYQARARQLRQEGPGEAELPIRLLLRTGQLDEARRLLEERAQAERQEPVYRPRAHRETLLLLSLVLAFQGEQENAYQCALEGTERGRLLQSPFITAVGYMRQGHAWLLGKDREGAEQARRCFQEAIALSESLEVPRLKVEAYWGLCQSYGFHGALERAQEVATQGCQIARSAGDEWIEASLHLALGAAFALAGQFDEAVNRLAQGGSGFRDCGDHYGEAVARLWQCLVWQWKDDRPRLQRDLAGLLALTERHGYDYLFLRRTLLGPPDPRALAPLLLFARSTGTQGGYANQLLGQLGLERLELHPGYQLRVQALGSFAVWRGPQPVERGEWTRKKALQLFHLLLTYRGRMLEREQITEMLWPEMAPEDAERDFKVAYSGLARVLEPHRPAYAPSSYLLRDGTLYGLRPEADLFLDVDEFSALIGRGDALFELDVEAALPAYRQALALYGGEYLRELPYAEWCSEERERLHTLYLRTADRVARVLAAQNGWEETIKLCQTILAYDDCWEQAYRLLMVAYQALGNRTQALRVYQRCQERLQTELGVRPSAATEQLYASML
jgi:two-component SAPR family response regulator